MTKLQNKLFYTLFSILTLSILTIIVIFNTQNYLEQKSAINNSLNVALEVNQNSSPKEDNSKKEPPEKPNQNEEIKDIDKDTRFMDATIYTILIDENNNIKEIINHSNNSIDVSQITSVAKSILSKGSIKDRYIGLLYITKYSYAYRSSDSLVILDNTKVQNRLLSSLEISILIFIILEVIIYLLSKKITNWIIKPVEESFTKQKQFIADASHELKTPLSVIIASTEALEENPKETKWLKNIKTEGDRMNNLITDLLELASTERTETYSFEEKDISKIIELSLLTFEGKAYEKNIKIDYQIKDNIKMKLDENSIKELVEILLDNAIKHSKEKSTIKVILSEENNNITLEVQNTGDPIPKGEEEKIFDRFYRIDKSRNRKENRYGLGLAIAKNITENHNGTISASSNDNTTTFKVLFKK